MRCVVYRNWRFIPPFFRPFFGHSLFSVSLRHCRPSIALLASFISALGVVVTKQNLTANVFGKGSVMVASEQDLEQRKNALFSRRIRRHGKGDTGRLAPGLDFRGMAFPPTQNPFSEVEHIALINGKAICSSDVSVEVRTLPERLDFGKP